MSDSGTAGPQPGYGWTPSGPRALRRSGSDRIISGVAGGLGEYFGVDAVIFRVLFAVLSFFGGVGLLAYGVAWLLIPEPGVGVSALDRAVHQLRVRHVPPWVVIFGGAVLAWLTWFSWWAPGPTFPAIMLLAVVTVILLHRLGNRSAEAQQPGGQPVTPPPGTPDAGPAGAGPAGAGPAGAGPADAGPAGAATAAAAGGWQPAEPGPGSAAEGAPTTAFEWQPPQAPLIPPLSDTRGAMRSWLSEAGEAHRRRVLRRRPIKIAVGLALIAGWAVVALLDAFNRVPFPAYLWVGLIILGTGLVASLVSRRMMLSLLIPMAMLGLVAISLGGTRASLHDGSGQIGWMPASESQLVDHRQFAGQSTLDLTALKSLSSAKSITLTQAAGEIRLRIPASLNATVIGDVHIGDIRNGTSDQTGQHVGGLNVHLELPPPAGATGAPLTIRVNLTNGHVQVDRIG